MLLSNWCLKKRRRISISKFVPRQIAKRERKKIRGWKKTFTFKKRILFNASNSLIPTTSDRVSDYILDREASSRGSTRTINFNPSSRMLQMYKGIKGVGTYFWDTRYTRVAPKVLTVSTSSRQNTLQVYTEVLKCRACLPARVASIQGGPVAIALEEENKSHFEMFEIRQSFSVLLLLSFEVYVEIFQWKLAAEIEILEFVIKKKKKKTAYIIFFSLHKYRSRDRVILIKKNHERWCFVSIINIKEIVSDSFFF